MEPDRSLLVLLLNLCYENVSERVLPSAESSLMRGLLLIDRYTILLYAIRIQA